MGLKKDANGMRLYPSGKPIKILLEHNAAAPDIAPVSDLTAQYLKKIGLDVTVKQIDSGLMGTKKAANEVQADMVWSHDRGWDQDITSGTIGRGSGPLWNQWMTTGGKQGTEPPDWVKKAYEIDTRRWQAVSGSDEYKKIVAEGGQWARDNLALINFVENVKYPMIASAKLGNVGQTGFAIGANFAGEQLYFK